MKIKLNKNQKHFLIDNEYITVKNLDALNKNSLYNYFSDNFDWILDGDLNRYNMNDLILVEKEVGFGIEYKVMLNFQEGDLSQLLDIK